MVPIRYKILRCICIFGNILAEPDDSCIILKLNCSYWFWSGTHGFAEPVLQELCHSLLKGVKIYLSPQSGGEFCLPSRSQSSCTTTKDTEQFADTRYWCPILYVLYICCCRFVSCIFMIQIFLIHRIPEALCWIWRMWRPFEHSEVIVMFKRLV